MDTQTIIAQAPLGEAPHLALSEVALASFQAALESCLQNWNCGDGTLVLRDNIPKLYGDSMFAYFKRTLLSLLGEGSELTIMVGEDGSCTHIQMSKIQPALPHVELPLQPVQTEPSEQIALDSVAVAAGLKKAPRPMNCWIIFRDKMHKQLKAEVPALTVQEISTRCSEVWRDMCPAAKKPYQDAAQSAKEEHLRQHPDYKYSPRKPGQKKKRQSRKGKRTAAVVAGPEILNFQLTPTTAPSNTATGSVASTTAMADLGNIFNGDLTQPIGDNGFLDFLAQGPAVDLLHDSESLRHARLNAEFDNAEFGLDFDMDMFVALFDEETFQTGKVK